MTRIDFYILSDVGEDAAMRFACALSLKAIRKGNLVHIHTKDERLARELDELMWDYPRHRFIPHTIPSRDGAGVMTNKASQPVAPVHIDHCPPRHDGHNEGLLINLGASVPDFFGRFDRVAEIIVGETRQAGRDRYRHYQDRGYPLHHHNLDDWESVA